MSAGLVFIMRMCCQFLGQMIWAAREHKKKMLLISKEAKKTDGGDFAGTDLLLVALFLLFWFPVRDSSLAAVCQWTRAAL